MSYFDVMPGRKSFLVLTFLSLVTTVRLSGECSSTVAVFAPPNACKSGTATVAVTAVPGATYAWTVDGGTIAGDATSDRVNLTFGSNAAATVSVTMTAGGCVSHGSSVIALRDSFNVRVAPIPAARAGEPLTLSWTYSDGSPARQTISGTDFGTITLAPAVRTLTYSPEKSGTKQIVIDAATDTAASTPTSSRQRAVAKSPAAASSCGLVHTAVPYSVGVCVTPPIVIDAPDAVVKEKSFRVTVRPQAGAVALWTITNGSPATATGEDVTITAGSSGNVEISVQLTRGACGDQAARSIPILAEAVCDHPTAVVSAGPISCGSAVVNVAFTGTSPFKGTWSDGVPFTALTKSFTRTVTQPFSYSINNFEDVMCAGTSSGVAVIPEPHPTATITATGNGCVGVDTITATFTGTPPFTGYWRDSARTPFQTNSMVISRPIFVNCVPGFPALLEGHDSTGCPITLIGAMPIAHVPDRVTVSVGCPLTNFAQVYVHFDSNSCLNTFPLEGPWTAVWSDGVTTSENTYQHNRFVNPGPTPTTYTVVRAHDAFCEADIVKPSVTPYRDPIADFTVPDGVCKGQTQTVSLATPPPQGARVTWSTDNGSIVSGQGTSTMQYTPAFVGSATIGCTFSFTDPEHCPVMRNRVVLVGPVDPPTTLTLASTQIHAGQTVDLTFTTDVGLVGWTWSNSLNDSITPLGVCSGGFAQPGVCHARYTSSHGSGVSTITMHAYGYCQTKDIPLQLTIVP
jgi:hypothetical protein